MSQDDACIGRDNPLTWKKVLSEHCLHRDSDRGLFWQYFSYIWKSSRCKGRQKTNHTHACKPAGQPNKVDTRTINLLLSLLLTAISIRRSVWVKEPLLVITADHSVVATAALPHLLLALHLRSLPCSWCCISEASYSTDITEMLQSVTNLEKYWPFKSALYVKMSHPPCRGNKIPLSRVLPDSFPDYAGKFCKRREKRQNAAVSMARLWYLFIIGNQSDKRGNRARIVLIVEVVYLRHVSEEDILPVPEHGRHEDEHGGVVHLSSVALRDAKGSHHSDGRGLA